MTLAAITALDTAIVVILIALALVAVCLPSARR